MATEKRLIDANALKAIFDKRYDDAFMQERTRTNGTWWDGYATGVNWGRNTITDVPTVDAVEVVHGRWRYDSYNMRYYCTECDEEPCKYTKTFLDGSTLTEEFLTDYCPNCGAKMDGDGND